MKKLLLLALIITLFAGCKKASDPVVSKDQLIGTIWQKKSFLNDQKLEFLEGNKIKYTLYTITNGVEAIFGTPSTMSYNISSGKPLVDNEAILVISSSFYLYDGYKISIYKDFLLWETQSPYDSSTSKDTYNKIK